jgi:hypothetical protein
MVPCQYAIEIFKNDAYKAYFQTIQPQEKSNSKGLSTQYFRSIFLRGGKFWALFHAQSV